MRLHNYWLAVVFPLISGYALGEKNTQPADKTKDAQPSLEMLLFLAEFQDEDGKFIAPTEFELVQKGLPKNGKPANDPRVEQDTKPQAGGEKP